MQVQLIVTNKEQRGRIIPIDVPEFRIGRSDDCHFLLEGRWVSSQHCVIQCSGDTVVLLDTSGPRGTFVNRQKISSPRELKDGDKIAVGGYSFAVSIEKDAGQTADIVMASDADEEEDSDAVFEIRHNQRNVSVTKRELFELARKGEVLPDDVIRLDGTKIFADSISGIVFGGESSAVTSSAASKTQKPEPTEHYKLEKKGIKVPFGAAPPPHLRQGTAEGTVERLPAEEPSVQVLRTPGAWKDVEPSSYEGLREQVIDWLRDNTVRRYAAIAGSVLIVLVILILSGIDWLPRSEYGAVPIRGKLMVDGKPAASVTVILLPRGENGLRARGMTDKNGHFKVTTGKDPDGRGAVPGEYDVTFYLRPDIPRRYEDPKTSGFDPIIVESAGRNWFDFNLSGAGPPQAIRR